MNIISCYNLLLILIPWIIHFSEQIEHVNELSSIDVCKGKDVDLIFKVEKEENKISKLEWYFKNKIICISSPVENFTVKPSYQGRIERINKTDIRLKSVSIDDEGIYILFPLIEWSTSQNMQKIVLRVLEPPTTKCTCKIIGHPSDLTSEQTESYCGRSQVWKRKQSSGEGDNILNSTLQDKEVLCCQDGEAMKCIDDSRPFCTNVSLPHEDNERPSEDGNTQHTDSVTMPEIKHVNESSSIDVCKGKDVDLIFKVEKDENKIRKLEWYFKNKTICISSPVENFTVKPPYQGRIERINKTDIRLKSVSIDDEGIYILFPLIAWSTSQNMQQIVLRVLEPPTTKCTCNIIGHPSDLKSETESYCGRSQVWKRKQSSGEGDNILNSTLQDKEVLCCQDGEAMKCIDDSRPFCTNVSLPHEDNERPSEDGNTQHTDSVTMPEIKHVNESSSIDVCKGKDVDLIFKVEKDENKIRKLEWYFKNKTICISSPVENFTVKPPYQGRIERINKTDIRLKSVSIDDEGIYILFPLIAWSTSQNMQQIVLRVLEPPTTKCTCNIIGHPSDLKSETESYCGRSQVWKRKQSSGEGDNILNSTLQDKEVHCCQDGEAMKCIDDSRPFCTNVSLPHEDNERPSEDGNTQHTDSVTMPGTDTGSTNTHHMQPFDMKPFVVTILTLCILTVVLLILVSLKKKFKTKKKNKDVEENVPLMALNCKMNELVMIMMMKENSAFLAEPRPETNEIITIHQPTNDSESNSDVQTMPQSSLYPRIETASTASVPSFF